MNNPKLRVFIYGTALALILGLTISGVARRMINYPYKTVNYVRAHGSLRRIYKIYTVYTPNTDWEGMIKFARRKGLTIGLINPDVKIIHFFSDMNSIPKPKSIYDQFDEQYHAYWVASYELWDEYGIERFIKYPAAIESNGKKRTVMELKK